MISFEGERERERGPHANSSAYPNPSERLRTCDPVARLS
jgi:hypothetical protein